MINNFADVQKLSHANTESAIKAYGEWTKGWQTLAGEMTDYSKRAFEDGTQTFEKLLAVKSVEQAVEIQSSYAKRAYDEYMRQLAKVGSLYTGFAKDAAKPLERAMQSTR